MAPKELLGRYKRYKHGTRNIIYWLTQTAASCCKLRDIVGSLSKPTSKQTHKPRAEAPVYEIRSHEAIELARAITKASPPVDIPEGILLIIEDVIGGREDCAEWYEAQQSGVEAGEDGHRAFIATLRHILEMLKTARKSRTSTEKVLEKTGEPCLESKGKKKKQSKAKATKRSGGDLSSAFAGLELEEPSANPLGDLPTILIADTATGPSAAKFRLEKQRDESAFETWCFLRDLADVREYVKQAWLEYSNGDLSFLVAGSVTATAIGLLRVTDEEFSKVSSLGSSNWEDVLRSFGLEYANRGRSIWICSITGESFNAPVEQKVVNILDLF